MDDSVTLILVRLITSVGLFALVTQIFLAQQREIYFRFHVGMMSYANSKQRNGFLLAVVHIVNRDWNELVKLYVRLGFIPEGTDLQVIEDALENALPDILNADVTELNFKNVINKLGDIMYVET